MAQVAAERLEQLQDPELSIEQAVADYRRLGYSESWINQRLKSIEVRKLLTDEWKRGGVHEGQQFASLTDIITAAWSGRTTRQYKHLKGLHKENLRDNMAIEEETVDDAYDQALWAVRDEEDAVNVRESKHAQSDADFLSKMIDQPVSRVEAGWL